MLLNHSQALSACGTHWPDVEQVVAHSTAAPAVASAGGAGTVICTYTQISISFPVTR